MSAGVAAGIIERDMCIPGKLPFLEHESSEVALLQQHLHVLRRQRDLCAGELALRLSQEFPRLLQGRRVAVERLLAAAQAQPRKAHLLRGRAYTQQVLLAQDTALHNKVHASGRQQRVPVPQLPDPQAVGTMASAPPASEELFALLEEVHGRAGDDGSEAGSSAGSNNAGLFDDRASDAEQLEFDEEVDAAGFVPPMPLVAAAHELDSLSVDNDYALAEPARLPAGTWLPSSRSEGVTVEQAFEWASDKERAADVVCRVACQGLGITLRVSSFATLGAREWLDSDVMAAASILAQVRHALSVFRAHFHDHVA